MTTKDSLWGLFIDTTAEEAVVGIVCDKEIKQELRWDNGPGAGKDALKSLEKLLLQNRVSWEDIKRLGVVVVAKKRHSSARAGVTVGNMLGLAKGVGLVALETVLSEGDVEKLWNIKTTNNLIVVYNIDGY